MATALRWEELLRQIVEAEVRDRDAISLDIYRWRLLEACADLSTARLVIGQPSPALDAAEAALLRPLEAASVNPLRRLIVEVAPGATGPPGRKRS